MRMLATRSTPRWRSFAPCSTRFLSTDRVRPFDLGAPASSFPAWAFEPRDFFRYELVKQSKRSAARVGKIHTPHGTIDTPSFVAVATHGTLKAVDFAQADAAGCELVFSNTYHLMLQPGPDVIAEAGGIHAFTGRRDRPFITDSGGFQVFSLGSSATGGEGLAVKAAKRATGGDHEPSVLRVKEAGVTFRSYRDGRKILLTPESSVLAQKKIGADITIPLDELLPFNAPLEKQRESLFRTHRWAARSLTEHLRDVKQQAMYGVLHGGVDRGLRQTAIDYITSLPFDGIAIGGSLGKDRDEMIELLGFVTPQLPPAKPRHLLGIADAASIERAVPLGIDTFDSCYPTRAARHGTAMVLTRAGPTDRTHKTLSLTRAKWKSTHEPIDPTCGCSTCKTHTVAYVHHLFRTKCEPTAATLLTVHNLHFMNDLMKAQRQAILDGEV